MPKWSPAGDAIVYIVNREFPQLWIIRPDGRGARKLVERGMWATWGEDGRWLYYTPNVDAEQYTIEKVPVTGGPPVVVRGDHNSTAPTVGRGVLYFVAYRGARVRKHATGRFRRALPRMDHRSLSRGWPGIACRSRRCTFIRAVEQTANGSRRD